MVAFEHIETLTGLERLQAEWLELWRSCPRATPFQSPQWLIPWTRHLYGGGRILAGAIRDEDGLIGFAPLFRWGIDRRTVSFLGAGVSDYGDLLFAPGRETECVAAVRNFLESERGDWDAIDLQEVRGGSGLLQALPEGWRSEECSLCPVLDLDAYPGAMDPKHRTDVKRARNKLAKSDLKCGLADESNLAHYMSEFTRLYEARWGALEGTLRRFREDVARAFLDTGNLRLAFLETGGKLAAAIFAFTCGRTVFCYLSAFDSAMPKLSPGAVLLAWLNDQARSEGLRELDFLRDAEAYKYLWGARDRVNYAIRASASAGYFKLASQ